MKILTVTAISLILTSQLAYSECVIGVKGSTKYQVIDSHTLILTGGYGGTFLLKSFSFFQPTSQVTVLSDSFCDFASAVLYVDGQKVDVQQVKHVE